MNFLLDGSWDLQLDNFGQIAVVDKSLEVAQAVSCAIRLFKKDAYFSQEKGVEHFKFTLGIVDPEPAIVIERMLRAALDVTDVLDAKFINYQVINRILTGSILLKTTFGAQNVNF